MSRRARRRAGGAPPGRSATARRLQETPGPCRAPRPRTPESHRGRPRAAAQPATPRRAVLQSWPRGASVLRLKHAGERAAPPRAAVRVGLHAGVDQTAKETFSSPARRVAPEPPSLFSENSVCHHIQRTYSCKRPAQPPHARATANARSGGRATLLTSCCRRSRSGIASLAALPSRCTRLTLMAHASRPPLFKKSMN